MPNFVVPWDLRHHPALRDEDIAEILGDLNASRLSAALAAIARTAIFELQWDDDLATDVIEAILRHPKGERAGQVSARLQEIAADLEDEARGTRWGVVAGADGWEKADRLSRQAELSGSSGASWRRMTSIRRTQQSCRACSIQWSANNRHG